MQQSAMYFICKEKCKNIVPVTKQNENVAGYLVNNILQQRFS